MNLNIFNGLPQYVRITILSQIRRLLSTLIFSYEDREDLIQELLLFYLKRFYNVHDVDEALVVHSIKQYATNLLTQRYHRRDFLYSSLADYDADEEFSFEENTETRLIVSEIMNCAEPKEKEIVKRILCGDSIDQISRDLHVSKKTIYGFFEKMRKKDHTVYVTEEIRKIPVIYLLDLEMSALDRLEKMVRDEVKRTSLALEWIQGIKNIKKASKDGGQNG